MFDLILVPLDGSAAAAAALTVLAPIPSRRVRLLTIEADVEGPMLVSLPEWEAWRAERARTGRAALEPAAERLRRQGREVETEVAFGDPAALIVDAAVGADLIVMASQGRGGAGRVVFGSVADTVSRRADCPTLIVRGGERPATAPSLSRLVVPLDGSPLAEGALPMAARLADTLGVPIHLVRVVAPDQWRATLLAELDAPEAYERREEEAVRQAETYLAGQVQGLRDRDLMASSEVRTGSPAAVVLETVVPGDLIVLSSHGRGGPRRWVLGSVAEQLVRRAPAPVLVVRPAQAAPAAGGAR